MLINVLINPGSSWVEYLAERGGGHIGNIYSIVGSKYSGGGVNIGAGETLISSK